MPVADRAQADDALADLAGTTRGRRLVISDRPGVRDRAAAAGAGVAGPTWLLGLLRQRMPRALTASQPRDLIVSKFSY